MTAGYLYPIVRYVKRAEATVASPDAAVAGLPDAAIDRDRKSAAPSALRAIVGRLLLAAALSGVALLGTWASVQKAPNYADQMTHGQPRRPGVHADRDRDRGRHRVHDRRPARVTGSAGGRPTCSCASARSGSIAGLYLLNDEYGPAYLCWAFVAGTITAAFYGWLPLYLPELFRTKVRATGQGFGYNFGRIIAAVGVLQLPVVMRQLNVGWQGACTAMSAVYLVGLGLIWLAPETKGRPLPA